VSYEEAGAVTGRRAARRSLTAHHARLALAGLLLLVVMLGARSAISHPAWTGPWHQHSSAIWAALDGVLLLLLLAVRRLRRRAPQAPYPAAELRQWLHNTIGAGIAVVTLLAILAFAGVKLGTGNGQPLRLKPGVLKRFRARPLPRRVSPPDLTLLLYGLLAVVLLIAIAGCVLVLRQRRRAPAGYDAELEIGSEEVSLQQAVDSGRLALRAVDDARAAIIACYVAMEGSLASVGTVRSAAETADELLGRAQTSGLLQGPAAAALVALFYEARFSSHALRPAARNEASLALDAISAELAGRAGERADAAPPAGTGAATVRGAARAAGGTGGAR
jgi:hypothetical protein